MALKNDWVDDVGEFWDAAAINGHADAINANTEALAAGGILPRPRTGVYQFEHPNAPFLHPGVAYNSTQRRLFMLPHRPTRFRVHADNLNFLTGARGAASVSVDLYIGKAAVDATNAPTSGMTGPIFQMQPVTAIPATGPLATGWVLPADFVIEPYTTYVLSFGMRCPTGVNPFVGGGQTWTSTDPADAALPAALSTRLSNGYLDLVLEYSFADDGAPTILNIGNSLSNLSSSNGPANQGEMGSFGNLWAQRQRGVFGNLAVGGAYGNTFELPTNYRWHYYDRLEVPMEVDVLLMMATFSSDLVQATPAATMVSMGKAVQSAQTLYPGIRILTTTNPPRGDISAVNDQTRRDFDKLQGNGPFGMQGFLDIDSELTDWGVPGHPTNGAAQMALRVCYQASDTDSQHWNWRAHDRISRLLCDAVPYGVTGR